MAPEAALSGQAAGAESGRRSPDSIFFTPIERFANHPTHHENLITDEC
jgi:hypothetical protein